MIDDEINPRFEGSTLVIETNNETETYDAQFLVAVLLVFVAKGDGTISPFETEEMLKAIGRHFHLQSGESLALLNRAIAGLADNPDLEGLLRQLSSVLTVEDKREIALMMLKVAAADGRKDAEEMEKLHKAAEVIAIPPDVLHQAFDDYFAETMA
ncbi:MAG: TerB family tellurite resistance protein [Woeseiaceae bacterium]